MSSSAGEDDPLAAVFEFANTFDDFGLHYFLPSQPETFSRLKEKAERAIDILDAIPTERRESPDDRAMYSYLRGKLLVVVSPGYNHDALRHLSEALELKNHIVDAWICLGTCLMKRGDLENTIKCFKFGLEKNPENKELLRHLSVVERRKCQEAENSEEIIGECMKHANEAVAQDVHDGISWYAMGNAHLSAYFVTGCCDKRLLMKSIKAYRNAAKDERVMIIPHMVYNFSMAYKFLEIYTLALDGFEAAGSKDPGLNAPEQVKNLYEILDEIDSLLQGLNSSPTSSLLTVDSLASSLSSVDLDPSFEETTVDRLTNGSNRNKAVTGKVLFSVKNPSKIPSYYVVCDSDHKCFVLTVYSICSAAIKEEDEVTLLRPYYHFHNFEKKGKCYQFKSVRVDSRLQLRVNGAIVSPEHLIPRSMYPQLKEA